jgi:uncharacterized membrane-anchored protein YhcB (DUF1043 family)
MPPRTDKKTETELTPYSLKLRRTAEELYQHMDEMHRLIAELQPLVALFQHMAEVAEELERSKKDC